MRVGLTGHYASGKSTVSAMFRELGASTLDTDKLARDVVKTGTPAYYQIVDAFGRSILNEDQTINRKKLGAIVFSDDRRLEKLNSITHPPILEKMLEQSMECRTVYIIDVPLLFQAGYDTYMDKVIIVTADMPQMIRRGANRDNIPEEDARRRIDSQNSINEYIQKADYIIDNSGTVEKTHDQVRRIWNSIITTLTAK
ncbi:MAG: dephospho-CoA kinase [Spirochaetota bacterium]